MIKNNNPYKGNILIDGLPPIPHPDETLRFLLKSPFVPSNILDIEPHIRLHYLLEITNQFNIPSMECCRLASSIDLMIRNGYALQNPNDAVTWRTILSSGDVKSMKSPCSSISASIIGFSGVGKTSATLHNLNFYKQIINHTNFPNIVGNHYQMVWQSIEVPGSGKFTDFMAEVMRSWDFAVQQHLPDLQPRFESTLRGANRDGTKMYEEWMQVAKSHFLGLLHIDEVQNFFDIPSINQRQGLKKKWPLRVENC